MKWLRGKHAAELTPPWLDTRPFASPRVLRLVVEVEEHQDARPSSTPCPLSPWSFPFPPGLFPVAQSTSAMAKLRSSRPHRRSPTSGLPPPEPTTPLRPPYHAAPPELLTSPFSPLAVDRRRSADQQAAGCRGRTTWDHPRLNRAAPWVGAVPGMLPGPSPPLPVVPLRRKARSRRAPLLKSRPGTSYSNLTKGRGPDAKPRLI
jgi:hypothetical protein